jgi:hypothetical protein
MLHLLPYACNIDRVNTANKAHARSHAEHRFLSDVWIGWRLEDEGPTQTAHFLAHVVIRLGPLALLQQSTVVEDGRLPGFKG